jgi:hypothetical protein
VRPGAPTYVKFANIWIGINAGGGPTPDKPQVFLDVHDDPDRFDTFLNLRVADIQAVYHQWQGRDARPLTPLLTTTVTSYAAPCGTPTAASSRWGQATGFLEALEGLDNSESDR